jgi:hypothetical protein
MAGHPVFGRPDHSIAGRACDSLAPPVQPVPPVVLPGRSRPWGGMGGRAPRLHASPRVSDLADSQ